MTERMASESSRALGAAGAVLALDTDAPLPESVQRAASVMLPPLFGLGMPLSEPRVRITNQPIGPLTLNSTLPDALLAVIHQALAKQKEHRFESGAQMDAVRKCTTSMSAVDVTL